MGYASRLAVALTMLWGAAGIHESFKTVNDSAAKASIDDKVVDGFTATQDERQDVMGSLKEQQAKKHRAKAMWYLLTPDGSIRAFAGTRAGEANYKVETGEILADKWEAGWQGKDGDPCHKANFRVEVGNIHEISFLLRGQEIGVRTHKVTIEALIEAQMSTDGCDRTDPAFAPPPEQRKIVIQAEVKKSADTGGKVLKTVKVTINGKVEPGASFRSFGGEDKHDIGEERVVFTDELLGKMNMDVFPKGKGFVKLAKLKLKTSLKITVESPVDPSTPGDVVRARWIISVINAFVEDQDEGGSVGTFGAGSSGNGVVPGK